MKDKKNNTYIAYIDIVDSRKIRDRKKLTAKRNLFFKYFEKQAQNSSNYLDIAIWKGLDEYMIRTKDFKSMIELLVHGQEILHPFEYRVVVAHAYFPASRKAIQEIDHPIFEKLVEVMTTLKKENMKVCIWSEEEDKTKKYLELIINSLLFIKSNLTENQLQLYVLNANGMRQEEISKKLKITQQYISKALRGIHFETIFSMQKKLLSLLNE